VVVFKATKLIKKGEAVYFYYGGGKEKLPYDCKHCGKNEHLKSFDEVYGGSG
jgi:hypothetical protein